MIFLKTYGLGAITSSILEKQLLLPRSYDKHTKTYTWVNFLEEHNTRIWLVGLESFASNL